jgi:hypothetical protein
MLSYRAPSLLDILRIAANLRWCRLRSFRMPVAAAVSSSKARFGYQDIDAERL